MPQSDVLIDISDYGFKYKFRNDWALKAISFKIRKGEFIIITGNSGGGKTTLLNAMVGLIPQLYVGRREGKILISGKNVEQLSTFMNTKNTGFIPQRIENTLVTPYVYTELAFPMQSGRFLRKEIKENVLKIAFKFNLEDLLTTNPQQISYGEKQKVTLASSLVFNPKIILADEPLANLDRPNRMRTISLFEQLNRKGHTIVIATHDIFPYKKFTTKIIELHKDYTYEIYCGNDINELIKKREKTYLQRVKGEKKETKEREILIKLNNVSYYYKQNSFKLADLSFQFKTGKIYGLIGDNGSGKTTLLKLINGLLSPVKGSINIGNDDLNSLNWKKISKRVSLVFQNPELQFFTDKVIDEMVFVSKNIGKKENDKSDILYHLKKSGLEHLIDVNPLSLSEGQKRRLAYISATYHNPDIILLDEITNGMDEGNKKWLSSQLRKEREDGKVIIISSHDWTFLKYITDEIILLKNGSIEYNDTTENFVKREEIN